MMNEDGETPQPEDLVAEGARARKLLSQVDGMKGTVEGIKLVNDAILAQVLFALWDSGFYEYSLTHSRFGVDNAAKDLDLDRHILGWLCDHLIGRGHLQRIDGELQLTKRGAAVSGMLVHGTFTLYMGGYGTLLANLGPLLRKEIALSDPSVARSGRHTAIGSEQLTSVRIVPEVLKVLSEKGGKSILDLGCGAGGFLIQLARQNAEVQGVGVDMSADAVAEAQKNALRFGVDARLSFVRAELGADPLPLGRGMRDTIEVVTAMYLLHEFGRGGEEAIVAILEDIRRALPGRLLLFTECFPADVDEMAKTPPTTFSQLDYLLIHPLSRQGPPLSQTAWKKLLERAGLKLVQVREISWIGLYIAET